ncbi:SDR family oxidoreductase [Mucilaginibacter segetis]|uniref:SDR family oxidoreductase n=1 Tax=Mucilaginibacter segetis TaxID=2793071 RepID=A0A934PUD2_9SPHI|nr:SDR family oxidoreductase [Mucilaginibacter segetis]MBK0381019.1 SDR family oxidoreductase [Mucilaginibacter segetis]
MVISILGCGWYGTALAKQLVKSHTVKGSTTTAEKLPSLRAEGILPFLIDLSADGSRFADDFFKCDILIIAIPPKARSGEGEQYIPKLQTVVNAIERNAINKVILISSTGVYADLNREVDEHTDPQPVSSSGKILFVAEDLFRKQTGFKSTIIRFGGLVGPGRDPARFFAGKKNIPNGLAPVNLIHLDDCVGFTAAVLTMDAFGFTFNACTPHHPSKFAFYTQAAERAGMALPEFIPELKEWKIVSGVIADEVLRYEYIINNWFNWLNQ